MLGLADIVAKDNAVYSTTKVMDILNLISLNGCDAGNYKRFLATPINSHIIAEAATEYSSNNAWNANFSDGNTNNNKYNSNRVRAVVALSDEIKEGWVSAKDDCCKNKLSSVECEKWRMNGEWDLYNLMYEIYYGEYVISPSIAFIVTFPAYREVFAAAFRDRIVQHWICLRLEPLFEKRFVSQRNVSFNCRKGFGTLKAVRALQMDMEFMSDFYHRRDIWVGRFDIKAFFMHIDRNILWALLEPFIYENYKGDDIDVLIRLTKLQVFNCPQNNCIRVSPIELWDNIPDHKSMFKIPQHLGLAIGNILSQLLANFYMSYYDAIMLRLCEKYGCAYERFVDDFTLVGRKENILIIKRIGERWLSLYLHLTLHKDKLYLQPVHHGCKFVGGVIKPHRTYLANRTFGGLFNQLKPTAKLCESIIDTPTVYKLYQLKRELASLNSYLGFSCHHKGYNLRFKAMVHHHFAINAVCDVKRNITQIRPKKIYEYRRNLSLAEDLYYEQENDWWQYLNSRECNKAIGNTTIHCEL